LCEKKWSFIVIHLRGKGEISKDDYKKLNVKKEFVEKYGIDLLKDKGNFVVLERIVEDSDGFLKRNGKFLDGDRKI